MSAYSEIAAEQSRLEQIRAREESLWRELARMLEEDGGDLDARQDKPRERVDSVRQRAALRQGRFRRRPFHRGDEPGGAIFQLRALRTKICSNSGRSAQWLTGYADLDFWPLWIRPRRISISKPRPGSSDMATFCVRLPGARRRYRPRRDRHPHLAAARVLQGRRRRRRALRASIANIELNGQQAPKEMGWPRPGDARRRHFHVRAGDLSATRICGPACSARAAWPG
jgi:hypothetical protein